MNPFEMVAIIVVAVMIASVLRAKYGHRSRSDDTSPQEQAENLRLREEVKELKERLKVLERIKLLTGENAQLRAELGSIKDRLESLERIATDQPSRLAREIDALVTDKGGRA